MITTRPFQIEFATSDIRKSRCRHTIKLGDTEYRCARAHEHGGIHDADERHDDGGLVRW